MESRCVPARFHLQEIDKQKFLLASSLLSRADSCTANCVSDANLPAASSGRVSPLIYLAMAQRSRSTFQEIKILPGSPDQPTGPRRLRLLIFNQESLRRSHGLMNVPLKPFYNERGVFVLLCLILKVSSLATPLRTLKDAGIASGRPLTGN